VWLAPEILDEEVAAVVGEAIAEKPIAAEAKAALKLPKERKKVAAGNGFKLIKNKHTN
jgi:hypothetical protein